jgi:hypothetical protein
VLEAGFLVLLAVVVGLADLDPPLIILVMAVGWLLVSLIEYFAWRQAQAMALSAFETAAPAPAMQEEVVEDVPPPPPPPPSTPAEEETIVAPPAAQASSAETEAPAEAEPEARAEGAPTKFGAAERRTVHRLEPLQPRPRRRWVLFGPYERPSQPPAEGDAEEER